MTKYGEEDLDLLQDPGVRTPLQAQRKRSPIFIFFTTVFRLLIPVTALTGVFLLAQFAETIPVTAFDRFPSDQAERNLSAWLTARFFVIPLTFFVIHLTNRAFGAALALGQVLITWTIVSVAMVYFTPQISQVLPWWTVPSDAGLVAFAIALFTGHLVAIVVFNMRRGPIWWKAPLYGGVLGAAAFVGLYYALAPIKSAIPLSTIMATDGAINFSMAILMLLPYWLMRPMIRPLPGYGGA